MKLKNVKDVRFVIQETISNLLPIDNDEDKFFVEGLEFVDSMLKELD